MINPLRLMLKKLKTMSVLVYTETENGAFRKSAYEVASYASEVARQMSTTATAIAVNNENPGELAGYGIARTIHIQEEKLHPFNAGAYAAVIAQVVKKESSKLLILSSGADAKFMAGLLAGSLEAGYVPNVVELPESTSPMVVKRAVFSNKGFAHTELTTEIMILGVSNNAFGKRENKVAGTVEAFTPELDDSLFGTTSVEVDRVVGKATIADADIIVSGGRGLKGPENWGMIEELASVLGAATACSKPVSDLGWRPHSEHVGQTGKPVASNLYIAIGISGAIQHLAGVNSAKVKVVINTDPEAPFFKAADYGIVGDAFEVVPELTEKLKEFKAQNS
jgi:electron transfer flavoprotein alpha subunit